MTKRISFFVGLLLFAFVSGQKKEQLQKQNAEIKRQIAEINANLAKTQKEAKLSVAYLNEVNKKIGLREKVYNNTQKEKKLIEDDIYLKQLEINRQKRELGVLRKNYADVLVKAYKNKGVQNKVTFILSSKNLGEAIRRVQYLKSYSDYQDKKAAEIMGAAQQLQKTVDDRQKSVKEKENVLVSQKTELLTIEAERKQRENLLGEFKKNEAELTAQIRKKQAESRSLESKIRSIIAEEIRIAKAKEEAERKAEAERMRLAKIAAEKEKARIEAENRAKLEAAAEAKRKAEAEARRLADIEKKKAEEARSKAAAAAKADATAKEEARKIAAEKDAKEAADRAKAAEDRAAAARAAENAIAKRTEDAKKAAESKTMTSFGVGSASGSNFAANRGKIGFPVSQGTITHYFGRQPHPVFKNIWEDNTGIKISVPAGTVAKCVFPGEVSKVFVDGGTKNVMVRHGNYFTIYSNLQSTNVTAGQRVSAGTIIGTVAQDYDGSYTLDFQIWNDKNPVDPMSWISR